MSYSFCRMVVYICQDTSAKTIIVDSLYFTIVSMTTVGYGDIYPQSGALARILGSLFILFGTFMLVRVIELLRYGRFTFFIISTLCICC